MSKKKERYLTIELPDEAAQVDFLSRGVIVGLELRGETLRINVKVFNSPEDSEWAYHEFEVHVSDGREECEECEGNGGCYAHEAGR